jgi:hypothetical protein
LKQTEKKTTYFFVDESGDPNFYGKGGDIIVGKPGCSRILLIGFIYVDNPDPIRTCLEELRARIRQDSYLKDIPSVAKTIACFHAKDDCPEVRMMVYKALANQDFAAQIIVARKIERKFRSKYQGNKDRFYEDLVSKLFQNQMHKSERNIIVFSRRGSKTRQHAMRAAVERGARWFKEKWGVDIHTGLSIKTLKSGQDNMLQAVDYANWAVQRAFERREMRYFSYLRDKYELIWDVFDRANYTGGKNFYNRSSNPFEIKKASPLD